MWMKRNHQHFIPLVGKNRDNKIPADSQSLFKIAVSISYMSPLRCTINRSMTNAYRWMIRSRIFPELVEELNMPIEDYSGMMVQHRNGIPNSPALGCGETHRITAKPPLH